MKFYKQEFNECNWGRWVNRTHLAQWADDMLRILSYFRPPDTVHAELIKLMEEEIKSLKYPDNKV